MSGAGVWERYRRFMETAPYLTVEWRDEPTGARGWLVLNSLRGGAAGGGTRMRKGLGRDEVVYLAKAMELKFAFAGPAIGGAKSGIDFDPSDPRRREVLERWFGAIRPFLATSYGTAGDVAVDEQRDVVPLCAGLGLVHPQEGIARGHMRLDDAGVRGAVDALRAGAAAEVTDPGLGLPGSGMRVSDLITGWGVARAAHALERRRGGGLEGRRVIVEGFGNVGASAALHLARLGARVVGVTDATGGLMAPDGLDAAEVEDLVRRSRGRVLPEHPLRVPLERRDEVYALPADLFVPAAISGSMDRARMETLAGAGVQAIVCGANQPFAEARLGATDLQEEADRLFAVVPDVVGSMGAARAFNHLMARGARGEGPGTPAETFEAVRVAVEEGVERAWSGAPEGRGLIGAAVGWALGVG